MVHIGCQCILCHRQNFIDVFVVYFYLHFCYHSSLFTDYHKTKKQVNLDCRSSLYWSLLLLFLISVGLDFMNYDKVILVNGF